MWNNIFLIRASIPRKVLLKLFFHTDLPTYVNMKKDLRTILKQSALERMHNILVDAVHVFTISSKDNNNCTGSGKYVKRMVNYYSIFRCELIAIEEGLDLIFSLPSKKEIWIFTDTKSAVQHLGNWHNVRNFTGMNILDTLAY